MGRLFKTLTILCIMGLAITSCKKKTVEGPTGPTGPQGGQGIKGNANVTNTTFTISSWTASGYAYVSDYLPLPNLDSTAFVSGVVMSYYMESSSFYPLPFNDGDYMLQPEYGLNYMRLYFYKNDHSAISNPGPGFVIRVVIVPPAKKIGHSNINYNNYSEVKSAFSLKE